MTNPDPALLLPRPKQAAPGAGRWAPARAVRVRAPGLPATDPALERLRAGLARRGHDLARVESGAADVALELAPGAGPEAYRLELGPDGVRAHAAEPAGLAHALRTLEQWLALHAHDGAPPPAGYAGLSVEDAPDLGERGVMLDVSRDRVPRMDALYALVERLAGWKLNRLQLYMEASFAYAGCERVWADASPFTADELRALDAFCRARHVELVPNQQSFGHLHKWLVHEPWRALAECPEGVVHPFSPEREPFSLCPLDPRALEFVEARYDELLACFTSGELNVGLDETFDLGLGRSRAACEERGKHRVYLEFLRAVEERVRARGRRMQFWGDIVLERPELVPELPADAVAMVWGYEAEHPFEEQLEVFRAAGYAFGVCPGTSSWNSIGGRVDNMLGNVAHAARAAAAAGARSLLTTDWGDRGHLQPPVVSEPGWLAAAEHSWNARDARPMDAAALAARLDRHAFADPGGGLSRALLALGRAHLSDDARATNGTALFYQLAFGLEDQPHARIEGPTAAGAARAERALEEALLPLAEARPGVADAALLCDELRWAGDALRVAARLAAARAALGPRNRLSDLPRATRAALREELAAIAARHRALWLARSRPGGLARSARWLERLVDGLAG